MNIWTFDIGKHNPSCNVIICESKLLHSHSHICDWFFLQIWLQFRSFTLDSASLERWSSVAAPAESQWFSKSIKGLFHRVASFSFYWALTSRDFKNPLRTWYWFPLRFSRDENDLLRKLSIPRTLRGLGGNGKRKWSGESVPRGEIVLGSKLFPNRNV